jgi:mannose-6-phosphate isomerase-like protein (cupin superfamily)
MSLCAVTQAKMYKLGVLEPESGFPPSFGMPSHRCSGNNLHAIKSCSLLSADMHKAITLINDSGCDIVVAVTERPRHGQRLPAQVRPLGCGQQATFHLRSHNDCGFAAVAPLYDVTCTIAEAHEVPAGGCYRIPPGEVHALPAVWRALRT